MKDKIRAIVFDIGGVLYEEDMKNHYSKLAKIMGYNLDNFYKVRKKYVDLTSIGKLNAERYLKKIAEDMKIKDFKKFKHSWINIRERGMKVNRGVERLVIGLKKDYITGTLTNIIPLHHKIRLKKEVYKHFKIRILSFKEGYKKPDIKFYKILVKRLKINPSEIVFIDDYKDYLKPAKRLGMHTILFKNNKQLVKELKKLNILVKR